MVKILKPMPDRKFDEWVKILEKPAGKSTAAQGLNGMVVQEAAEQFV